MKHLICFLCLILAQNTFCQKVKRILEKGQVEKLVQYLEKGGDINETILVEDEFGFNPLSFSLLNYAVYCQCKPCVDSLLVRKDAIENFDLVVTEAFIYSLSGEDNAISEALYTQNPIPKGLCDVCHGNNALMVAAIYGREDWYFRLRPTSDIEYINAVGATLVHSAASGPSQKIADDAFSALPQYLNKKDAEELTALDYAASNEENPSLFNDLIKSGAKPLDAWNLLYWWSTFPEAKLSDDIIEIRRTDAWKADQDRFIPLTNFAYFYAELETEHGILAKRMHILLDIMIADFDTGKNHFQFDQTYYRNKINDGILDAMLYIEDFSSENPVYPKYLKLLGIAYADTGYNTLTRKNYKTACKIYGEDVITKWYEEAGIPIE